jgi:hypothetical protein
MGESVDSGKGGGKKTPTRSVLTKQLNVRLPRHSHDLLDALMSDLDMTQVQVLIVALEHLALVKGMGRPRKAAAATPDENGNSREL